MSWPNFLIIGAARSGTTSLYHYLQQHPDVYMSAVKEPNYFAVHDMDHPLAGPGDRKWYEESISRTRDYLQLFEGADDERSLGEASPTYMHCEGVPEAIHDRIPDVRLIAILRNPVDRAISHYRHEVREGREPLSSLAEALREEERRLQDGWFWPRYKTAGFYYRHLRRFERYFPRNQVKVILFRDFVTDPLSVMRDVHGFLGVDEGFDPDVDESYNRTGQPIIPWVDRFLSKSNFLRRIVEPVAPGWLVSSLRRIKNANLASDASASPSVREALADLYLDDVKSLESWLDRELSDWMAV